MPGSEAAQFDIDRNTSEFEDRIRDEFIDVLANTPIPRDELLDNLGLFMRRQTWARLLFLDQLYKQILDVHGIAVEFGVRWGQNLAFLSSLRGMYEPANYTRKIVGFDTFTGFPAPHANDGDGATVRKGAYAVPVGYEDELATVLQYHENESPLSHIRKFELVKGDVTKTLDGYLSRHPETIIAFAYFDLDLYEPTKYCLERIRPHLTRGSVLGFDELNAEGLPGETVALREVLGLENLHIRRVPHATTQSYVIYDPNPR